MEINFNLASLKIVYEPLSEYFKKVQENISANIITIKDDKKVVTNFEYIEIITKVQNTLKMIGLFGVVEVLRLTKEGLDNIKEVKYDNEKSVRILQKIDLIYKDINVYLQSLLNGENDQPTKFYEQYQELSLLLNKAVNISNLFFPKLEYSKDIDKKLQEETRNGLLITQESKTELIKIFETNTEKLNVILSKIENVINNAKFTEKDLGEYQNNCKEIYALLNEIQKVKISKNIFLLSVLQKLFICIISPMFNDKFEEIASENKKEILDAIDGIKITYENILEEISRMDTGEKTSVIKSSDQIIKNIVYFIITSIDNNENLKEMPIYKETKLYIDLDYYKSQLGNMKIEYSLEQKDKLGTQKIDDVINSLKEEVALLTSKQSSNEEYTEQHLNKFKEDILKVDGFFTENKVPLRDISMSLNEILARIKTKEIKFSELLQKEIALSVLLLEYGVNSFVKSVVKKEEKEFILNQIKIQKQRLIYAALNKVEELKKLPIPIIDDKNKKEEERKVYLKIYAELSNDFMKSEEVLINLLNGNEESLSELESVFKTYRAAKNIFAVLGKIELSKIIDKIISIWNVYKEEGNIEGNKEDLSNSISWISGISLAIKAAKENNQVESEEIIDSIITKFNMFELKKNGNSIIETHNIKDEVSNFEVAEPVNAFEDKEEVSTIEVKEPEKHFEVKEEVLLSKFEDFAEDQELLDSYLEEAEEIYEKLKVSMKELRTNNENESEVLNIRRYFHTLKGSGKMVGLINLGECAWIVEQTLNKVIAKELVFSKDLYEILIYTSGFFNKKHQELLASKKITIDVNEIFNKYRKINKNIMTHLEVDFIAEVEDAPEYNIEGATEISIINNKNSIEEHVELDNIEVEYQTEGLIEEPAELDNGIAEPIEDLIEEPTEIENVENYDEETILINGKEINKELYDLYKSEAQTHVKNIKIIINNLTGKNHLNSSFIIAVHTMGSISQTVALNDCSIISRKLEQLANMLVDKHIIVLEEEVKTLKNISLILENISTVESIEENNISFNKNDLDIILSDLDKIINRAYNYQEVISV